MTSYLKPLINKKDNKILLEHLRDEKEWDAKKMLKEFPANQWVYRSGL